MAAEESKIDPVELCRRSLASECYLEFMKYVWQHRDPFLVGRHTRVIAERLDRALLDYHEGKSTYLVVKVPFRHGKALALDTPVPTPCGWSTMERLRIGDQVFGSDGKPCEVVAKSPVWRNRDLYAVSIDNGRDIILADAAHEWVSKLDRRSKWKIYDTKTIAKPRRFSCPIKVAAPLTIEKKWLPIPPYTLGYWLGNGSNYGCGITTGDEDRAFIRSQVEKDGYETRTRSDNKSFGVLGLQAQLKKLGLLKNKHIPAKYLRSSVDDRMALLQGLIDSDGEVGGVKFRKGRDAFKTSGQVTFCNTKKQLALDALELVRTLGVKASMTTAKAMLYEKDCGEQYKVSFYMKGCARLSRKNNRTRNAEKFILHSMTANYHGTGDTVCIQVNSPDSLFLVGKSLVPTHNSDLVSRYFPPYVFGKLPEREIILATYNQNLSNDMSRDARTIMRDEDYQKVFDSRLAADSQSVEKWGIEGTSGKFQATGIDGGATGKGADILIIDDYLKGRKDAESGKIRDGQWSNFTGNLMTRLAPVHIVIVLATPWHVDDIIGRIENRCNPDHQDYDEDFPKCEIISFPARGDDYESGYLFPERFSEQWYRTQFATLGAYQAAGLLQCSPTVRGGNMLKVENVQVVEEMPADLQWVRFWDLASTEKERAKDDPDYTAGARVAVRFIGELPHLYIDDLRECQSEAPERDRMIVSTAKGDGAGTWQAVESVAGYKDAYTTLKKVLKGISTVHQVNVSGDKVVRAGEIEPVFEAGHVHVKKSWWTNRMIEQLADFPAGSHDDIVDSISGGYPLARDRAEKQKQFGNKLMKGAVG
jgi:predicted phage terminase large subunit-like protein